MAPIGSRHAAVVNTLAALLSGLAGGRAIVSVQNPLIVGDRSVPQPDLLLLKFRSDRYFDAHPTAADVLLVVEVSDTTLRFDLDTEIPLYAHADIDEAWLINLESRTLVSFSNPSAGSYGTSHTVVGSERLAIHALPNAFISIAAIFPA